MPVRGCVSYQGFHFPLISSMGIFCSVGEKFAYTVNDAETRVEREIKELKINLKKNERTPCKKHLNLLQYNMRKGLKETRRIQKMPYGHFFSRKNRCRHSTDIFSPRKTSGDTPQTFFSCEKPPWRLTSDFSPRKNLRRHSTEVFSPRKITGDTPQTFFPCEKSPWRLTSDFSPGKNLRRDFFMPFHPEKTTGDTVGKDILYPRLFLEMHYVTFYK